MPASSCWVYCGAPRELRLSFGWNSKRAPTCCTIALVRRLAEMWQCAHCSVAIRDDRRLSNCGKRVGSIWKERTWASSSDAEGRARSKRGPKANVTAATGSPREQLALQGEVGTLLTWTWACKQAYETRRRTRATQERWSEPHKPETSLNLLNTGRASRKGKYEALLKGS